MKKLNFVHHIANLAPHDLAREVYDLQVEHGGGLHDEVEEHLSNLGVTDLRSVSKWQWRKCVKKYIFNLNKTQLLEDIKRYKKLDYDVLSKEPFERKPYLSTLSLKNARMRYRVSSGLVQTIRSNYPRKYKGQSLACPGCIETRAANSDPDMNLNSQSETDSQIHVMVCDSYSDFRGPSFDPEDDKMLAEFFLKVVTRRMENGED